MTSQQQQQQQNELIVAFDVEAMGGNGIHYSIPAIGIAAVTYPDGKCVHNKRHSLALGRSSDEILRVEPRCMQEFWMNPKHHKTLASLLEHCSTVESTVPVIIRFLQDLVNLLQPYQKKGWKTHLVTDNAAFDVSILNDLITTTDPTSAGMLYVTGKYKSIKDVSDMLKGVKYSLSLPEDTTDDGVLRVMNQSLYDKMPHHTHFPEDDALNVAWKYFVLLTFRCTRHNN